MKPLCDPVQSEGAPMLGAPSEAPSGTTINTQMESHLLQHARTRRLGALDEEQVEVGPLLGRGSFGRVYKGERATPLGQIMAVGAAALLHSRSCPGAGGEATGQLWLCAVNTLVQRPVGA